MGKITWRRVASDWADTAINGLQHLRNIVELGVHACDPRVALANMEECVRACNAMQEQAVDEPNRPEALAAFVARLEELRGKDDDLLIADEVLTMLKECEAEARFHEAKTGEILGNNGRIRRLMEDVGMPNSRSLYNAFHQLANEVEQKVEAKWRSNPGIPVKMTHLACIEDGKLRMMSGYADWKFKNVELYAFPDLGNAPPSLFTPRQPWGGEKKVCHPCQSSGAIHCAHPDECGGPWTAEKKA